MTKITCFFLLLSSIAMAQVKSIDSMLVAIKKTNNSVEIAQTLNHIADAYKTSDPKLMLTYAKQALALSKKIGNKIEEGNALHHLGNSNIIVGNYAMALDFFSKAQLVFESELPNCNPQSKTQLQDGLARAYGSIGLVFMEQSNYAKALQYNFKALQIYEVTNNQDKLARIYNNIGVIFNTQEEWYKAIIYYEKCLKIQEKKPNDILASFVSNIGLVYNNQKNYTMALVYFNKAKTYFDKYPNPRGLGQLYNNYGDYYFNTNNQVQAIANINKAIDVFESIDNKSGIANCFLKLGTIYANIGKTDLAIVNLNKSLEISKELNIYSFIVDSEKLLSEIYEKEANTVQALLHYKLFKTAADSIVNQQTNENALRAELNFEFDRKEILRNEAQMKRDIALKEQAKSQKWKILYSVLLALFAAGIAFLIYNSRQIKKNLTLEKELAIYEQKALHLQMNPHFIFNCLGSISSFIVQNSTDAAIKYLAKFSKLMRLTLEYSKETLIPIDKEIESLQNYLELEQLRFNNQFSFEILKCNEIEDDVALPPLLLQPFVENAIIHGMNPKLKHGNIKVTFALEHDSLVCTVLDNGIGINKSKANKATLVSMHKSMALDITKKRLDMLEVATTQKSKLSITEINENNQIVGTKAALYLPLQYIK